MSETNLDFPVPLSALNVLPSPDDTRDFNYEARMTKKRVHIPNKFSLKKQLLPIRNQGNTDTCVGQVGATIKEWQELKDINLYEYMSPQFIYNNRENQDSSGMYGRDCMSILKNIGSCLERNYPFGTKEEKEEIDPAIILKASNFQIKEYNRISSIKGLKEALYLNGPCFISVPVYQNNETMWKPASPNAVRIGGHAMTIVGYDSKGFIIRNSWGLGWGKSGYGIFPYSDWGLQWEIWTAIDESSESFGYEPHTNILDDEAPSGLFCCCRRNKVTPRPKPNFDMESESESGSGFGSTIVEQFDDTTSNNNLTIQIEDLSNLVNLHESEM